MNSNLTDYQVGLKGQLWINFPITILMGVTIWLSYDLIKNLGIVFIIATVLGWIYWRFAAAKWVKWAHKNKVNHERIYTIGKSGWLIWSEKYINAVVDKNQKPWF